MSERVKFIPTHCLKGESPLPVMLLREADGTAFYHDGFVDSAKMLAAMFHRIYMPIDEYDKRPPRKKKQVAVLAALKTDGPLPTAKQLANRARKKAPRQPKQPPPLGLFV